jgi:hypothetical protein|tara:strand:- start:1643 stop:2836 length:1194 start_codon:yes stop_codon:yes gene_type:complete
MLFNDTEILVLAGFKKIKVQTSIIFSELSIDFLNDLSKIILKDKEARNHSEIISFGFWCRKNNIINLSKKVDNDKFLSGRGLVLHLPPSNVPINFIYSFSFGLLHGNSNIVKLPSKNFISTDLIIKFLKKLFIKKKYKKIFQTNSFIKYDSSKNKITKRLSSFADVRMIWGGDKKVQDIKSIESKVNTVDIAFFDKYSISVINTHKLSKLTNKEFDNMSYNFFSDAFFMDQNACGSPHIIFWLGKNGLIKNKFWKKVSNYSSKMYNDEEISVIDKFYQANTDILKSKNISNIHSYNNLYVANLKSLPGNLNELKGKWGYFYEFDLNKLNDLANYINNKFQTLIYFGLSKENIKDFLNQNLKGIDRIVPIGQAHQISTIWDGYNLTYFLSREIDVREK